ncbi:MAG: ZIP family zinc transporter [Actinomycetota bacterium]|nr:ZIP family zinc transporter [Actinomycetota bacterium]
MPEWVQAGMWGLLSGGALVVGAAVAWLVRVPPRVIAGVMAFGAGVLISALAFDLMAEAADVGGLGPTALGFVAGAVVYTVANVALARRGARHRKRSGDEQPSEDEHSGSGTALALGALLDGVPESVVLGVSLLGGGGVSVTVVAAVFISNVPEGLSSAAGMRSAGRSARYVFGLWSAIAVASGVAALVGNLALGGVSPAVIATITAVAAGAVLAMLTDTMIPEAVERAGLATGLLTVLGFLTAFSIERLGE